MYEGGFLVGFWSTLLHIISEKTQFENYHHEKNYGMVPVLDTMTNIESEKVLYISFKIFYTDTA